MTDDERKVLQALVNEARGTYGDYCEEAFSYRVDLRRAVAAAERLLGIPACPGCVGLGVLDDYKACRFCSGSGRPA